MGTSFLTQSEDLATPNTVVQLFDWGFFFGVPTVLETWIAGRVMSTKSSLGGDGEETIKDKK